MKFKKLSLVLIVFFLYLIFSFPNVSFAQDKKDDNFDDIWSYNFYSINSFSDNNLFINCIFTDLNDILPTSNYFLNIFENILLTTIPLIEETGGFSFIDPEKLSINGYSLYWNNWYLGNSDISDVVFQGSSGIKIPDNLIKDIFILDHNSLINNLAYNNTDINNTYSLFFIGNKSSIIFNLYSFEYNINKLLKLVFENKKSSTINIEFNYFYPFEGKNIEWTANIDDFISSLNIPSFLLGPFPVERNPPPPIERRRVNYNFNFNFNNTFIVPFFEKGNYNTIYFKKEDNKNNNKNNNKNIKNIISNKNYFDNISFPVLFSYNIDINKGQRQFLDFNLDGSFKNLFYENWSFLNIFFNKFKIDNDNNLVMNNNFDFEYRFQDKLFAQNYYSSDETAILKSLAFFYSLNLKKLYNSGIYFKNIIEKNIIKKSGNILDQINLSVLVKLYSIKHNDIDFVREIIDPDGEGLFPFYPEGYYYTYNINFSFQNKLDFSIFDKIDNQSNNNKNYNYNNNYNNNKNNNFNNNNNNNNYNNNENNNENNRKFLNNNYIFLNFNNKMLYFAPFISNWENKITYNGTDYGKISFSSNDSLDFFGNYNAGIESTIKLGILDFDINQYFQFSYYFNNKFINSIVFLDYGFDFNLKLFDSYFITPFISFSKTPVNITSNLINILNPDYFNSYYYVGNDSSDYTLINTTGGSYISVDKNLKQPAVYSFEIGSDIKVTKQWNFKLEGLAKLFENTFWILFKQNSEDIQSYGLEDGEYVSQNGYDIFFFNQINSGEIRDYLLTNYNEQLIGGGKFFDKPFYAGAKLQILGEKKDKWLVDLSFTAYLVMGITSFGNGPLTNDIGNVDFSMANPNTWINGYGRIDSDRAYVGKGVIAFKLFGILWNSFTIKYRDGQPFAFYDTYENTMTNGLNQIALIYHTIQAENEIGLKGGPREDSLWNFDYKLSIKDLVINIPVYKKDSGNKNKINKQNYNLKNQNNKKTISLLINFSLTFVNFLDLANELSENVFSGGSRASLELEIPGSIVMEIKMEF